MQTKARKIIYSLGAAILAVVVFLLSAVLAGTDTVNVPTESSSSSSSSSSQQQSQSSSSQNNSESNSSSGNGGGSDPVLFKITTPRAGRIYLRQDSKGNYTGFGEHGFVGDKKYYLENATDINPLYYLGESLKSGATQQQITAQIELVGMTNDLLPYGLVEKTGGINDKTYNVTYYQYDYMTMGKAYMQPFAQLNDDYFAQEEAYRDFVETQYLSIPSDLKQTLLSIANGNGIYSDSANVVNKVVNYIRNAAYYDYEYVEKNYPDEKDMVTYFLTEHRRGVCRHFATDIPSVMK